MYSYKYYALTKITMLKIMALNLGNYGPKKGRFIAIILMIVIFVSTKRFIAIILMIVI